MIKVEGITKEFKNNKKYPGFRGAIKSFFSTEYVIKKAVEDISFEIKKGEIVGYIGANGAGKSTTIKMMTGILTPTTGKITVDGLIPYENRQENAKNIGVVFGQKTQLWWDLPLSETFSLLKEIYDVSDEDYDERMKFLNDILGFDEFLLTPVRSLSLGQRMRADIAASLLHNPKVVYLDEPTIGLDVMVKEKVRRAIKEINERYGTTIILTTHDLNDIEELCSRIIIIDKGQKIYDGSLEEIKNKYGAMTSIEFQVKDSNINLQEILNYKDLCEGDLKYDKNYSKIVVTFNKNKISSSDIMNRILSKTEVIDFKIIETSIEDIIKKIYSEGV